VDAAEGVLPGVPGLVRTVRTPEFAGVTFHEVLAKSALSEVPVGLGLSVAIGDPALHASLEPGTPSPTARLDVVRAVADAGLRCGVMVAPVLPWLTDSTEDLDALLGRIAAAGASGATVLPLHLRPGAREWYLGWVRRERPDLLARYEALYARGAYAAGWYRDRLAARVAPLLARHRLDGAGVRVVEGGRDVQGFPAGSLPDVVPGAARTAPVEQPALF